jgi:hypothetical protein
VRGYSFDVSCSHCSGELEHLNEVHRAGTESLAVMTCTACRREFCVTVLLRAMPRSHSEHMRDRRASLKVAT